MSFTTQHTTKDIRCSILETCIHLSLMPVTSLRWGLMQSHGNLGDLETWAISWALYHCSNNQSSRWLPTNNWGQSHVFKWVLKWMFSHHYCTVVSSHGEVMNNWIPLMISIVQHGVTCWWGDWCSANPQMSTLPNHHNYLHLTWQQFFILTVTEMKSYIEFQEFHSCLSTWWSCLERSRKVVGKEVLTYCDKK